MEVAPDLIFSGPRGIPRHKTKSCIAQERNLKTPPGKSLNPGKQGLKSPSVINAPSSATRTKSSSNSGFVEGFQQVQPKLHRGLVAGGIFSS